LHTKIIVILAQGYYLFILYTNNDIHGAYIEIGLDAKDSMINILICKIIIKLFKKIKAIDKAHPVKQTSN